MENNENYYTIPLILLVKIVLRSKFHTLTAQAMVTFFRTGRLVRHLLHIAIFISHIQAIV